MARATGRRSPASRLPFASLASARVRKVALCCAPAVLRDDDVRAVAASPTVALGDVTAKDAGGLGAFQLHGHAQLLSITGHGGLACPLRPGEYHLTGRRGPGVSAPRPPPPLFCTDHTRKLANRAVVSFSARSTDAKVRQMVDQGEHAIGGNQHLPAPPDHAVEPIEVAHAQRQPESITCLAQG